ncbi:TonB-dependent receptor [Pedobacter sp. B4-66]|uniref:TonB-dependent receptor n=1 Tax=Pedobacter sp. B4-66 TaxID=2817280 RepID=UPI001BDB3C48|nr:TonB-dependent receptor [Pedobacter sp. B4-66]
MRHCLLIVLLSFFTTIAFAQTGNISGIVTDHHGKPVAGAAITLKELKRTTATDDQGKYEITSVTYGKYTLMISSVITELKSIAIKVDEETTVVNVHVKGIADRELKQVMVEGKSKKREIETSGFAVNVVDTKAASLRNLQTNELLNRTVGVRVRQTGGFGSNSDYNLNGMSGRAIGIFIDGIEISTYGSSFNLNNIPPSMIERIEVYKGVLPAHLSGDYLGGGINVVLKKGAQRNNLTASASYGSFNTQQTDLSGMYRDTRTGLTLRGSGFYGYSDNDYEVWGKWVKNQNANGVESQTRGKRFNDGFKTYGGRLEAGFTDVKWADNFMLNYNGSYTYKEIQHGQYMSVPYMGRFSESKAHIIGLDYVKKDFLLKGLKLTFNGVYSDRKEYLQDTVSYRYNWDGKPIIDIHGKPFKSREGAQQGPASMADINRQIGSLRAGLSYNIADGHKLVFNHGFYTVDRQDADQLKTILEQMYDITSDLTTNVSTFTYEMDALENRLKTNVFVKYYQQNIERVEPQAQTVNGQTTRIEKITKSNRNSTGYGFAGSYALKSNLVLIASAERALRMPGEGEVFGNQSSNLLPNPNIKPETSNNFNLGFRAGSYGLGEHKVSLSVSGFLRNTQDKIVIRSNDRPVTVMPTSESVNLPGTRSIGFEAELNYVYRNLNVMLNTSKFNTLIKDEVSPYHNKQIPNEPFFTVNGNAQYRMDNVLQKKSTLNLYYNFGFVNPFETTWMPTRDNYYRTPNQFIQDVGASYLFPNKKVVVSFDAKNIFNKEAYDNFASQRPGRAFYLKLNYTINNF